MPHCGDSGQEGELELVKGYWARARAWLEGGIGWVSATPAGRKWAGFTPRSQEVAAGGAIWVVLILVVTVALVLGPLSGSGGSRASGSAGPQMAEATASPTASASPTATALPTMSASSSPSVDETSPRKPAVLASVGCSGGATATTDGRLYVACANGTVVAIDLATDTAVKNYFTPRRLSPGPTCQPGAMACTAAPPPQVESMVVDGALWVQWDDADLQRFDLSSGTLTGDVSGIHLVGDNSGSVWVQNSATGIVAVSANEPLPDPLSSIDFSWVTTTMACGSIWKIGDGYQYPAATVARSDPQTGEAVWLASIPGSGYHTVRVIGAGSTCWAAYSDSEGWHLTRLGSSCLAAQETTLDFLPFELGNTTWVWETNQIYRFDMSTGKAYGQGWIMPFPDPAEGALAAASGQVWAGDNGQMVRLDISLSQIPDEAALSPLVCATASPTPTMPPTPSPSPAATAEPTATGTATPTPFPSPSPLPSTAG